MKDYQSKYSIRGVVTTLLFVFVLSIFFRVEAYALTAKIAFSDPSAATGEEFSVRMKISSTDGNGIERADIMLSYDTEYLEFVGGTSAEGGAGSVRLSSLDNAGATQWVYDLKFKALKAGNTKVGVSTWEIYDNDVKMATLEKQGSSSITISGENATEASVGALSSLSVNTGELNPAFSADIKEYTLNVGEDVTSIEVNAVATEASSTVQISGNTELVTGSNKIQIDVAASDGTTSTYIIHVNKGGTGTQTTDTTVQIGGKSYNVVEHFDDALIPSGFSAIEYNYKGKMVKAAKAIDREVILIYLLSSDATGDLFVYDEAADTWSPYAELTVSAKTLTIVPLGSSVQIPSGFVESTIELNGKTIQGWIFENDTNMESCIVYAMNANGEKNFYRYDLKEKTVQRYLESYTATSTAPTEDTDLAIMNNNLKAENSASQKLIKILYGVIAVLVLGLIFALISIVSKAGKKKDESISEEATEDSADQEGNQAFSDILYEMPMKGAWKEEEFADIEALEEDFLSIEELDDLDTDFQEMESVTKERAFTATPVKNEVKEDISYRNVAKAADVDDDFEELDI